MTADLRLHPSTRSAARRSRATAIVGGAGAIGFGAVTAAFPLAIPVVIAVPLVVLVPLVAVAFASLADGASLPLLLAGRGTSQINTLVLGAVLVALLVPVLRRRVDPQVFWVVVALGAATSTGVLIAIARLPLAQTLSGIRYVFIPLAVALLATTLGDRALRMLLRGMTVVIAASFVAAIVETAVGSDRLLALTGLSYGVSIRNIGSALRAPGLFATNFHLGAFSGVAAVVALLWWGSLDGARRDVAWRAVALVSAVGALVLSTYRTGVILLVVAVVAAVVLRGTGIPVWVKTGIALVGAGVAVGFQIAGLGDAGSLFERIDVWRRLLAATPELLGRGIGFSGAASGAAGSARDIFTDNYYISLWLQFGVLALVFFVVFVVVAARLVLAGRRGSSRAALAACLWIGVLVAFVFVELWEYTSAMCLVSVVVGASVTRSQGSERIVA